MRRLPAAPHAPRKVVYTQTCCTNSHAEERVGGGGIGTHVHADNRNRAQMKRLIKICTASNAKEKYLLGRARTSHFERTCARARASQRCHHGDEVISDIYPANHLRAHHYHTLPALPPLPLISAPLSLGRVRSQRSLSVLTC